MTSLLKDNKVAKCPSGDGRDGNILWDVNGNGEETCLRYIGEGLGVRGSPCKHPAKSFTG